MRAWPILLLLSFGCVRDFAKASSPEASTEPSFLGSVSGVYQVRLIRIPGAVESSGESISTLFNVIEVGDRLVFATATRSLGAIGNADLFSFSVKLDRSGPRPSGRVEVTDPSGESGTNRLTFVVETGFDALNLSIEYPEDAEGFPDFCRDAEGNAIAKCITLEMQRLCDFDARLSGVFAATVTPTAGAGCAMPEVREVAIAAGNGIGDAMVVGLSSEGVAFGGIGEFSGFAGELTLSRAIANTPLGIGLSSFEGHINVASDRVLLNSHFEGSFGSCAVAVQIEAERLSGVRPGISCPSAESLCSPIDSAICPDVPASLGGGRVVYEISRSSSDCPTATCSVELDSSSLCERTRRSIMQECAEGQMHVLRESESTAPGSGDVISCFDAPCTPYPEGCSYPDNIQAPPFAYCGRSSRLELYADGSCTRVRCDANDAGHTCPPPLECAALLPTSQGAYVITEGYGAVGCVQSFCSFFDPTSVLTAFDSAARATIKAGFYQVDEITPRSAEVTDPSQVRVRVSNGERASCSPVDLSLLDAQCPTSETVLPVPADTAVTAGGYTAAPMQVILENPQGALCLRLASRVAPSRAIQAFLSATTSTRCVSRSRTRALSTSRRASSSTVPIPSRTPTSPIVI
jgi:hypothetical protein